MKSKVCLCLQGHVQNLCRKATENSFANVVETFSFNLRLALLTEGK